MLECDWESAIMLTLMVFCLFTVIAVPAYFVRKEQEILKSRSKKQKSVCSSKILYRNCEWGPEDGEQKRD